MTRVTIHKVYKLCDLQSDCITIISACSENTGTISCSYCLKKLCQKSGNVIKVSTILGSIFYVVICFTWNTSYLSMGL